MESTLNCNPLINDLNAFSVLYKSMRNLTLDQCFDHDKMVFVPFDAKKNFQSDNDANDYYIFLKNEELEKITNLFTKTINDACCEHLEGKLNVSLFHLFLDRIETSMPDVKDTLVNLANKAPALTDKVNKFILHHKEALRSANTNITDNNCIFSSQSKNELNPESLESKCNALNLSLKEINKSIGMLDAEVTLFKSMNDIAKEKVKTLQKEIANNCYASKIINSTLVLSRTSALEILHLVDKGLNVPDEEIIEHLEETAKIRGNQYKLNGVEGSLQDLIFDIKACLNNAISYEQMTNTIKELPENLAVIRNRLEELNKQIMQKETEKKAIQEEIKILKLKV